MGHHDHGAAFLGQALDHLQNFAHQLRVQRRRGFIEQHHLRLHGQGAGDGDTLLLAAGEERRVLISHARRQPDFVQVAAGTVFGVLFTATQHAARGHGDVFQHAHVAPQIEVLEHHRQPRAQALQLGVVGYAHAMAVADHANRLAVQGHGAIVGGFQKVDTAQEGTLA